MQQTLAKVIAAAAMATSPAWAVGVSSNGPALLPPDIFAAADSLPAGNLTAGAGALIPLVAADLPAQQVSIVDASTPRSGGADKLVDDIAFVARATERGYEEIASVRSALPQLQDPELKRMAETLAAERDQTNSQLARIAAARDWPVPPPRTEEPPPAGRASADFDATWTDDMISAHERSLALYSAQAQAGEDRELRKYARDRLPTLHQQLAELRRLQK